MWWSTNASALSSAGSTADGFGYRKFRGFAQSIQAKIDAAKTRGAHQTVRYLQDVLVSAHDFNSYPENRRNREETAGYSRDGEAAIA